MKKLKLSVRRIKQVYLVFFAFHTVLFSALSYASDSSTVSIDSGRVKGSMAGEVISYKGIPYAAPPVGELRWRSPQPARHWSHIYLADHYGSDCMQQPFPSDAAPLGGSVSEDCLYLNVWRPKNIPTGKKLPVMVWIYGGGFVNGGSSPAIYSGAEFAARGIVFVSFNYRLGRFGFFGFPALTAETPKEPKGNYGYLDQIAALKWVQRNIASFGGDPRQVTIVGESAGGGSVLMLLTSPLSQGLFARAVVESGGGRGTLMPPRLLSKDQPGLPSAEAIGVQFARSQGIEGTGVAALGRLRKLSAEQICNGLGMQTMMQQGSTYSGPIFDGQIVVETPQEALLSGHWAKVPVMIGANSMDIGFSFAKTMTEVFAPFGTDAQKASELYNPEHSEEPAKIGQRIAADKMMVEPARFVARTVAAQGIPAYEYRFSYVAGSMRSQWAGAPHATEIPYVFHTVRTKYQAALTKQDDAESVMMHSYWVNFAKTGDPNGKGLTAWPQYDGRQDRLLNFTEEGAIVEADPWHARLDLIEQGAH